MTTLRRCTKFLNFTWDDALKLSAGLFRYSLTNADSLSFTRLTHDLRDLLRVSAWSSEASRRPKDFQGAEVGVVMDNAYACYKVPYGPSLLTGGSWTAARLFLAGRISSPLCARCFSCWDTKEHRLWWCEDNAELLSNLRDAHPTLCIDDLPNCVRRCGLVPLNFPPVLGSNVANYLLQASARATAALANFREDITDPPDGFPPVVLDS
jgi:hypothetical protein